MDPRDAYQVYFRSYFNQMDVSGVRDGLKLELVAILGDRYDKEKLMGLGQSNLIDEFIRELDLTDTRAYNVQGQVLDSGRVIHF